jgi:hypothetical protein
MANNIERLNYYEREYLRSFDFIAEQNYHLEMRRRLNLALHLWGIVEGLDVLLGEVVEGAPAQYYISPGMAIDAYGREIFLFAPYILSEDDVQRNRITLPGRYSLFIEYASDLTTPPAAGYAVCDLPGQYTRRHESYQIIISNELDDSVDPKKAKVPSATDELSDDPSKKRWPVRLGSVDIDAGLLIAKAWPKNRTYIGVRAQRIVAPVASLGDSASDANRPISVEADLRARKNTIIGKDFEVLKADTPSNPPDPFPKKKGNLKVRHDVFLRGEFYKQVDTKWLTLTEYMKTLIPDIQIRHSMEIPVNPLAPIPSSDTVFFDLTSNVLTQASRADMMAALCGIESQNKANLTDWWNNLGGTEPILRVEATQPVKQGPNTFHCGITWTVGPHDNRVAPADILNIKSLFVSYVMIFYP